VSSPPQAGRNTHVTRVRIAIRIMGHIVEPHVHREARL
jgi:hypothetical protein